MNARTQAVIAAAMLVLAAQNGQAQDAAVVPSTHDPVVGHDIAQLGNRALATIRAELAQALRDNVGLPALHADGAGRALVLAASREAPGARQP